MKTRSSLPRMMGALRQDRFGIFGLLSQSVSFLFHPGQFLAQVSVLSGSFHSLSFPFIPTLSQFRYLAHGCYSRQTRVQSIGKTSLTGIGNHRMVRFQTVYRLKSSSLPNKLERGPISGQQIFPLAAVFGRPTPDRSNESQMGRTISCLSSLA